MPNFILYWPRLNHQDAGRPRNSTTTGFPSCSFAESWIFTHYDPGRIQNSWRITHHSVDDPWLRSVGHPVTAIYVHGRGMQCPSITLDSLKSGQRTGSPLVPKRRYRLGLEASLLPMSSLVPCRGPSSREVMIQLPSAPFQGSASASCFLQLPSICAGFLFPCLCLSVRDVMVS